MRPLVPSGQFTAERRRLKRATVFSKRLFPFINHQAKIHIATYSSTEKGGGEGRSRRFDPENLRDLAVNDYSPMWAIVLLLLSIGFVATEAFVPSFGILGACAVISALSGIVLAFFYSPVFGAAMLGGSMVIFPILIYLTIRWWPYTPVGRRVLLRAPSSEEVLPDSAKRRVLRDLVGKLGKAKTVMLPSGAIYIDGRTVDAVSEGLVIEEGQVVKVIEVRGTRVVVRAVDESLPPDNLALHEPDAQQQDQTDPLLMPFNSLGFDDPFDEDEDVSDDEDSEEKD